jgi:hypothetical protein
MKSSFGWRLTVRRQFDWTASCANVCPTCRAKKFIEPSLITYFY